MGRLSDNTLGEAEATLREAGFDYPIAWALYFLVSYKKALYEGLVAAGQDYAAEQLLRLVNEIKTGEIT